MESYQSHNSIILFATIFFTTFASSMVSSSPVLFLLKHLAATDAEFAFYIGVMVSVSSLAMISANFVGGFLADRLGRKSAIILGAAILAPSLFAYSLVPNAFFIIIAYFFQMFSISFFQPAFTALVADMSGGSSRGKAFGRFNLFWIGSVIPGPFVGGVLVDSLGLHFPFIIAALVSLVGLTACFGLVEVSKATRKAEEPMPETNDEKTLMPFRKVMVVFGTVGLLSGLASGLLVPLSRLYPIDVLRVSATQLGLILSVGSALVTTLVQVPGGGLTDRYGRKSIMLFSLLGAPFVFALGLTNSVLEFILVTAGLTAFGNIAAPAYYAWQMELVSCSKRAIASGLINSLTGIGMFLGPFISIWLYQSQPTVSVAFAVAALSWVVQIPPILKLKETSVQAPRRFYVFLFILTAIAIALTALLTVAHGYFI